jgi:hypothetical protein
MQDGLPGKRRGPTSHRPTQQHGVGSNSVQMDQEAFSSGSTDGLLAQDEVSPTPTQAVLLTVGSNI